mmetsp:Transcript_5150/g.12119  ORF Transcript_5150/g.12119 Transcript_5150/m.12119 type:complete len:314 (+) Transcript_5150:1-942(+)
MRPSSHVRAVWRGAAPAVRASPASALRQLLADAEERRRCLAVPCCYDALSASVVVRGGFPLTFMSGFGVAATLGMPDTGLITQTEMVTACRQITSVVDCNGGLLIADGDTGFGNAVAVKRTVKAMAQAGAAAVMIEDQVAPKRCGYIKGKGVLGRTAALSRIQAAVDARNEGADILILARTDAATVYGIHEAVERAVLFRQIGADISHLSAPQNEDEMRLYCVSVEGPKMANNNTATSNLKVPRQRLAELGYTMAIYPDMLLGASLKAMKGVLRDLKTGAQYPSPLTQPFSATLEDVGFADYNTESAKYNESD